VKIDRRHNKSLLRRFGKIISYSYVQKVTWRVLFFPAHKNTTIDGVLYPLNHSKTKIVSRSLYSITQKHLRQQAQETD